MPTKNFISTTKANTNRKNVKKELQKAPFNTFVIAIFISY